MQGLGFLLKSALLLAGVSSKVSYWLESLSVSFYKFSSRKERFCWVSIFCLIEFMLCDHRAMAIEDYGFLLSNPKSPPSLLLYQKKTENQEKSDSRGRKSDFFLVSYFWKPIDISSLGELSATTSLGTKGQFLLQLPQHWLRRGSHSQ